MDIRKYCVKYQMQLNIYLCTYLYKEYISEI